MFTMSRLVKDIHWEHVKLGSDGKPNKSGRSYKILREEFFVEICLTKMIGTKDCEHLGLTPNDISANRKYWKDKYGAEINKVKSLHYSNASKYKSHDYKYKDIPGVLLDEKEFRKYAELCLPVEHLAKHFKTSVWYVFKNLEYYKIEYKGRAISLSHLEKLEYLSKINPNVVKAAESSIDDPFLFYEEIYKTFLKCWDYLDIIAEFKNKFNYLCESGSLDRKHICFNSNKGERMLANLLMNANIAYRTQFPLKIENNNFTFDFAIEGTNILIEVDGKYHKIDDTTKKRDILKNKAALEKGYDLYRIDRDLLERNANKVFEELQTWILERQK